MEYINREDAIGILDDFYGKINDDSRIRYLRTRYSLCDMPTEEIIYCKDCKHYCNVLYKDTQFEHGYCDAADDYYIENKKPYDFCSWARLKE